MTDTADKSKEADPEFAGSDNFSITVECGIIDITARIGNRQEALRFIECLLQVVEVIAAMVAPDAEKAS